MELGDDLDSEQAIDPENYSPRTLSKEIGRRGSLSLEQCLQLGLALSDALAQLHRHGLIHRDIKPSNIIFVNGVPKLADIGLVAEVNEARSYVGTEGYIPPEGPGTAQADIYGLGKVLYEASTGKDRKSFPELPLAWSQGRGSKRVFWSSMRCFCRPARMNRAGVTPRPGTCTRTCWWWRGESRSSG